MSALEQLAADQDAATAAGKCACLCGKPASPGSKYNLRDRCRQRAQRRKVAAAAQDAGIEIRLSLEAVRNQTNPSRPRNGDALRRRQGQRKRNPDVRVSYRKALAAVTLAVGDEHRAQTILQPCLPPRLKKDPA